MADEKKYFLEHVGDITIRKRKGSRRISIRINPAGEVRMVVPYFASYSSAISFLERKKDWIIKTREKISRYEHQKSLFTEAHLPKSKYHEFLITRVKEEEISCRFTQGLCELFIPENMPVESEQIQDFIKWAFTEALRKEAKVILVNRCLELARKHDFRIKEVRVKDMKTRWGSCSSKGNINLNLHLMQLPQHLIDYVIFHELVHTIHPHHGEKFWKELDHYVGNSRKLAAETRKWGSVLR